MCEPVVGRVKPLFPNDFCKVPTKQLLELHGGHDIMRGRTGPFGFADVVPYLLDRMPGSCYYVIKDKCKHFVVKTEAGKTFQVDVLAAADDGAVVRVFVGDALQSERTYHYYDVGDLLAEMWGDAPVHLGVLKQARADCVDYSLRALLFVPWVAQQPKMAKIIAWYEKANSEGLPDVRSAKEILDEKLQAISDDNVLVSNECGLCYQELEGDAVHCHNVGAKYHPRCAYEFMFLKSRCFCDSAQCYADKKDMVEKYYLEM
jgi:hypothetical protein